MPWDSCVITLNSDSTGSLYCGDIVTGFVRLEFKNSQKINNIEFLVYGRCKAHWSRPKPVTPYIKLYSQKKKLLYINIDIFESINGTNVKQGVYDFPFHFVLPEDLPSSFVSSTGKVDYWIKINSNNKHKVDKQFIVLSNVNLNSDETFMKPAHSQVKTTFWNTGQIELSLKTYKGFASKQIIPIEILIKNEQRTKICKVVVSLIQKLHFVVTEGYKDEEKEVCNVKDSSVLNGEQVRCYLMMEIPHLTPSSILTTEPMIGISYVLRVALKLVYHLTVCQDIPVIVATVPVLHYDFDEDE